MVSGCSQDEVVKEQSSSSEPLVFTASFEENKSRTYLNEDEHLRWNAKDLISIFATNTYNQKYEFQGETGANSGDFKAVTSSSYPTGNELSRHYAIYPYNSSTTISENGAISATLPAEQSYAVKSFGLEANTMVASTADKNDRFLKFKNVGGYLEFNLYGNNVTVKSITLQGNSNEKIAGSATITPTYNGNSTVVMANNATNTITLDCGDGVSIGSTEGAATAFWMVVPPTTFEDGFTINITDINGNTFTKSTSKSIKIERNVIQSMNAFEVKTDRIINVNIAGTLPTLISSTEKYQITSLKVIGYLNGTDISFLQGMSKGDGSLTYLDLSEAHIVAGGSRYDYYFTRDDSGDCKTTDNVVGRHMFRNCKFETIILPNSAISIGSGVLSGCINLTSVYIPKNIQSIDFSYSEYGNPVSFQDTPLLEFIVDDDNQYLSVSNGVLFNKDKTKLLRYPQSKINTFYVIPETVVCIGKSAFLKTINLTSINIPNTVTSIEEAAFAGCAYVTELTLSNKLEQISKHTFRDCGSKTNGISSLTIHEGVKRICKEAFHYATIRELYLPSTLTDIDYLAFIAADRNYSKGINAIYCAAINPPFFYDSYSEYWIGTNPTTCILYVPKGSKERYESSNYWPFTNIKEIEF